MLTYYYGDRTYIPGQEIVDLTKKHKFPTHTLLISDTDIQNLESELSNLRKAYENSKAGGSIFLCTEPTEKTNALEDIGYNVVFARDFDDLGKLTLEKSKELYGTI